MASKPTPGKPAKTNPLKRAGQKIAGAAKKTGKAVETVAVGVAEAAAAVVFNEKLGD